MADIADKKKFVLMRLYTNELKPYGTTIVETSDYPRYDFNPNKQRKFNNLVKYKGNVAPIAVPFQLSGK